MKVKLLLKRNKTHKSLATFMKKKERRLTHSDKQNQKQMRYYNSYHTNTKENKTTLNNFMPKNWIT